MDANATSQNSAPSGKKNLCVKIIGVGSSGAAMLEPMAKDDFSNAALFSVNTDAQGPAHPAIAQIHLETRLLRGLGTGGDPERGR